MAVCAFFFVLCCVCILSPDGAWCFPLLRTFSESFNDDVAAAMFSSSSSSSSSSSYKDNKYNNISAQWYTEQRVDHFNPQDNRTWSQLFYVNDTYFNPNKPGPVFFQLGGEGSINAFYVTQLEYVAYAQHFGALIVALEHRFYGSSHPLPDMSTDNLRYLSSQQALADASLFMSWFKNKVYKIPNAPVVTFGCSYSGNLASWFRGKYSTDTVMAIASSAPVQATMDFFQYLDVVDKSLEYFTGQECVDQISNATQQIQQLLTSPSGVQQLVSLFGLCTTPISALDQSVFMQGLMGLWMGLVQYNKEIAHQPTVKDRCDQLANGTINNNGNVLKAYAQLYASTPGECTNVSYSSQLSYFESVAFGGPYSAARAWFYQTCTEFGYFQTTDGGSANEPFGDKVPVSLSLQMCRDVFGVQFPTAQLVNETNTYYGGSDVADGPTKILFVNGDIDPWHALSVIESRSVDIPTILIDGTAHCANVMPASPNDPPGLVQARKDTMAMIDKWLASL